MCHRILMSDEQTNTPDTKGTSDNSTPKESEPVANAPKETIPEPQPISPLIDRAEAANKEKASLLERDEKLTERKEKLHALQMIGGNTTAGQAPDKPKVETAEEKAARFESGNLDILEEK